MLVYGRNGVQAQPVDASQRELGIIIETSGKTREAAVLLASLLTHYLIHYGYPGRKATAGNIAYPLSPNLVSFEREDGSFGAIVPSGTRDPVFFENYAAIKAAVMKLIEDEFPDALANATYTITDADACASGRAAAHGRPRCGKAGAASSAGDRADHASSPSPGPASLLNLDAPDAYAWSLYHLLQNEDVIKNDHVPDHLLRGQRRRLDRAGLRNGRATSISARRDYRGNVDDRTLSLIADHPPAGAADRLAPPARHGRRHSQQGCRHQPPDLRHHLHVRRKLRGRAALQRLRPLQRREDPQPAAGARGRHLFSSTAATRSRFRSTGRTSRLRWTSATCSARSSRSRSSS